MVNSLLLATLRATQSVLLRPVKDKYSLSIEDDKVRVGASSMQGWRSTMEDAHCVKLSLPNLPSGVDDKCVFAGVFDGHCGPTIAQKCARSISGWLTSTSEFHHGKYGEALHKAYIKGDSILRKSLPDNTSGCTGNTLLIVEDQLFCANSGDTRAVLSRNGKAIPLSEDHKPNNPTEESRIRSAGMGVAANRVGGLLALSRAFGDFLFKDVALEPEKQAITVVPDIRHLALTSSDEFVIIACDGVWDTMSNQEAVDFFRSEIAEHHDLSTACERLLNSCISTTPNGLGTDNMTVLIIEFKSSFLDTLQKLSSDEVLNKENA